MYYFILAQAADPISGGAGWVGAGLLGLVLGWLLLKHLPDKDRQSREELERHLDVERKQREAFQVITTEMMAHNRQQIETVTKALSVDLQALRHAVDALRDMVENRIR